MAQRVIQGMAGSSGSALGRLVRASAGGLAYGSNGTRPRIEPADRRREQDRLRAALECAAEQLARLADETQTRAGAEIAAIFEAQAMFARDPALVEPALSAIADDGIDALEAIGQAAAMQADTLAGVDDEYFRARAADIRDVGKRVTSILEGRFAQPLQTSAGEPCVLASDDL